MLGRVHTFQNWGRCPRSICGYDEKPGCAYGRSSSSRPAPPPSTEQRAPTTHLALLAPLPHPPASVMQARPFLLPVIASIHHGHACSATVACIAAAPTTAHVLRLLLLPLLPPRTMLVPIGQPHKPYRLLPVIAAAVARPGLAQPLPGRLPAGWPAATSVMAVLPTCTAP